ncbi:taperin [Spea bombifrons]|uniref:taperin n=1 Tax=Spea bombifrons TaxID=233779 RepID=UPI00234A4B3B|nr:taperin [Spea bombifrons]
MAVSAKGWARPGPESGNMPAWKLEVLERKRAKMGSLPPASRTPEQQDSPERKAGPEERLVLQESLGPLHENPFIKQEKERRRRRGAPHSPGRGSPIRQLLDLYSNVPGIRTIRADNIIIIESDPAYFGTARSPSEQSPGAKPHHDPMEELMAKRGSKVAEIRASKVVIYEPEKAKEPLGQEASAVLEEAGRVSRLLEKFDRGHSKPVRARSWENLLDSRHSKPTTLPKPPSMERRGRVQSNKARRSGDVSPSSASLLDEDSKRFPLNNPSWLPDKLPSAPSLPDPGLFHKRPSSPVTPPASVAPLSPSSPVAGPLPPPYESSTDEKFVSPVVASVIEKFEVGSTRNNLPLPKLMGFSQKTSKNTIMVNPKAASHNYVKRADGNLSKETPPLINGHIDRSSESLNTDGSIRIEDLLNKSRTTRSPQGQKIGEGTGQVPSSGASANENLSGANTWRPKSEVNHFKPNAPPESGATQSDTPLSNHCEQGMSSATPSQQKRVSASTSSNDSFEIRPAPKPDLRNIPESDVQAKALANIRAQSKNSFVFIPKNRQVPGGPPRHVPGQTTDQPKTTYSASVTNGPKVDVTDAPAENGLRPSGVESASRGGGFNAKKASSVPALSDFDWKSGLLPSSASAGHHSFTDVGAELEYFSSVPRDDEVVLPVPVTKIHDVPITNIDDIIGCEENDLNIEAKIDAGETAPAVPSYRPHAALSSTRNKGGNTFTVIPKRRPLSEQEAFRTAVIEDEDDETRPKGTPSEAPYSELGAALKKRYPTAEEIQVIGGYLSLSKSCLSKDGSTRKKMKISFNEQNIHTMFEYPSEASLAEETGEEEPNEASGSESEEDERPSGHFLPRPTFVSSGVSSNGLRANSANSGLSSYTPKHSVQFSKWQEENPPLATDGADAQREMLTPADGDSHPDFRSEPALYF